MGKSLKKGDKTKITLYGIPTHESREPAENRPNPIGYYGATSHIAVEGSEDQVQGAQGGEIIYGENKEKIVLHTVIEQEVVAKKNTNGLNNQQLINALDIDSPISQRKKLYKCPTKETFINQKLIDDGTCKLVATEKLEEEREEDDPEWDVTEDEDVIKDIPEEFLQGLAKPGSDINEKINDLEDVVVDDLEELQNDPPPPPSLDGTTDNLDGTIDKINEVSSPKARDNYGTVRYPEDIDPKVQDFIKFGILKYKPTKFEGSGLKMGFSDRDIRRKTSEYIGTIILPIPGGIQDQNQVDWGDNDLNAFKAQLASLALQLGDSGNKSTENAIRKLTESSGDVKQALKAAFTGRALGTKSLLSRTSGKVINPNLELLFNGPNLRQFSFDFFLSPRSESEAKNVINIIRMFKQASAVQRTDARIFLSAPNTFQVTYHKADPGTDENTFVTREHPYIGKMKECAITSVGVEYTPENNFARFESGHMTQYKLSLQMQELEPIFNNDYDDPNLNNENNQTYADSTQSWTQNIGF